MRKSIVTVAVLAAALLVSPPALAQDARQIPPLGNCLSQPSLSPLNLACKVVELDETAVRPLSLVRMVVPGAPAGTLVKQVAGPDVTDLSYHDGVIEFVTPKDTGSIETLAFNINLNLLKRYVVSLATRQRPMINRLGDGNVDDDGSPPTAESKLALTALVLVYGNVFPTTGSAVPLRLMTTTSVKFGEGTPTVTLINDRKISDVSAMFELDTQRRTLSLKPADSAGLAALLDRDNALEIVGSDSTGVIYAYEVRFFRGSNTLNLTIVDQGEAAYIPTSSKVRLALRGNDTGVTSMIAPSPSGAPISIPMLPDDSYEIGVIDVDRRTIGSGLFAIRGDKVVGHLKLAVVDTASSAATFRSTPGEPPVTEYYQPAQGPAPEPRVLPRSAPAPKAPQAGLATGSDYGMIEATSSGQGMTRSATQTFQVPNTASPLTVSVTVRSSEYPAYTSNPDNPTTTNGVSIGPAAAAPTPAPDGSTFRTTRPAASPAPKRRERRLRHRHAGRWQEAIHPSRAHCRPG